MIIQGFEQIDKTLKDLPNQIRTSAIRAGARKAAKPIIRTARQSLVSSAKSRNTEGQSKLAYVARNIKAKTLRSKNNPGVYVGVNGRDIPVGKRFWDVRAYAILLGEGSYKTGERRTRSKGANRGRFRGLGNFIQRGAQIAGNQPSQILLDSIDVEVKKAFDRAIR